MRKFVLPLFAAMALGGCATDASYVGYSYGSGWGNPYYGSVGISAPLVIEGHGWRDGRGMRDRDGDGIPNRMDRDRDGDGVRNRADARPNNPRRQ
ncbi:hypothetical protein FN976_00435 [Caenimonas sedimenti]|uniref:Lipoprotein n=1 Tax=Caenimonas sedimenti TaxID=2596921 RepID=A0A562ZY81_9BURK|nr:thrombospondin type 3 repeat-containing protein [Caenimonas sedimenti]TWO73347.1 hypothetical protein FN976_00435 [Caenimonas sedimenti]